MKNIVLIIICLLGNSFLSALSAQNDSAKVHLNGQLVGWTTLQAESPLILQPGGRFVPALTGKFDTDKISSFDFEVSFNINGYTTYKDFRKESASATLKPYRVWMRYATDKFELRGGLQKINFGQAKLFRPLMWFDGMDVRDPLQLTDGVYGLLGKYFFENNASVWAWGLIGNKNTKGWELNPTEQWKPELGGRLEMPVFTGEMALSTNFRQVHTPILYSSRLNDYLLLHESRIGLDGKWDLGFGMWFESSTTITQKNTALTPHFQDMWNAGIDYTFPLGNGLGATIEYLRYHAGEQFFVNGTSLNLIGTMFTYPVSIIDNLSAMLFFVPVQNVLFNYFSWSRTYDKWSFYAIAYLNPPNSQLLTFQSTANNLFSGKGIQLMAAFNF